ncbi:NlpC/P60 family protein [Archangium minus]|uniref:NlpC/P60 family protein n=1 Tax=Archangium minus TaxID=83450 RepID=A0ABY9X3A1_9BACT|nr:NlpC/P60 family protein [Archangium violaceum]WNG49865.1 NlpC/P60 family protein [Archangium minus]
MSFHKPMSLVASSCIFALSLVGCNVGPEEWEGEAAEERMGVEQQEVCSRPADYLWEEPDSANVKKALTVARDQICKPVIAGGSGPDGFDSVGLPYFAYSQAGFNVSRVSVSTLSSWGRTVRFAERRPGDLIIYRSCAAGNIAHVSIYMGHNKNTGAPQEVEAHILNGSVRLFDSSNPSPCLIASSVVRVQG